MTVIVRQPSPDDADRLGEIHVEAWQHGYRGGLMPDEYLDGLDPEERAQMWAEELQRPTRPNFCRFVSEDAHGRVVGFITAGPAAGDPESEAGEVFALNIDPDRWGEGHGTALLKEAVEALRERGFEELLLWAHPGSERARRFYELHGWRSDGEERQQDVLGVQVAEIRYRLVQ